MVGFSPNFHGYIIGTLEFGDLDLIFKVTTVEKLKIHGLGTSIFSENTVTSFSCSSSSHFFFFCFFLLECCSVVFHVIPILLGALGDCVPCLFVCLIWA